MEALMQRNLLRHLAVVSIALVPAVYLMIKWDKIPGVVPVHFNASFEPDRYSPKNELWTIVGIMTGTSLLTYLLLENLHKIDPKRKGKELPAVISKLSTGTAMFMSALCLLVILSCIGKEHLFDRFLLPMLGFLFAFLGNLMHSIKPNYFAGIRIPWTLRSDNNWKETHQFAGKLWFWTGITMILIGLFMPVPSLAYIVPIATLIMVLLPILYSYNIHRNTIKD